MEAMGSTEFQNPDVKTLGKGYGDSGFIAEGSKGTGFDLEINGKDSGRDVDVVHSSDDGEGTVEGLNEVADAENVVVRGVAGENPGAVLALDREVLVEEKQNATECGFNESDGGNRPEVSKDGNAGSVVADSGVGNVVLKVHTTIGQVEGCGNVCGKNRTCPADVELNRRAEADGSAVDGQIGSILGGLSEHKIEQVRGDGNEKISRNDDLDCGGRQSFSGDDSSEKNSVKRKIISLFVDFRCTPNGISHGDLDEDSCAVLVRNENNSVGAVPEDMDEEINDEQHEFSVGAVVWIKTKGKSWWPGKVCDPLDKPADDVENDHKNCLLVRYFGHSHVSWCHRSQLKHFAENFKQMSTQNKSRSFVAAVEKGVDEFCKCVKLMMTCPCFLNKHQQLAAKTTEEKKLHDLSGKSNQLVDFSSAQFEPCNFVAQLKNLALVNSMPGLLECTITRGCLSAFYYSLGHCELPMNILCKMANDEISADNLPDILSLKDQASGDVGASSPSEFKFELGKRSMSLDSLNDDSKEKNENSSKSRERKKSKYLSFPYVNWVNKAAPSEGEHKVSNVHSEGVAADTSDVKELASPSLVKCTKKKKVHIKLPKKLISESDMLTKKEFIRASPAKFLSGLQAVALDYMYANARKDFNVIEWFIYKFRSSEFHDDPALKVCSGNVVEQKETANAEPVSDGKSQPEKKRKRKKITPKTSCDEVTASMKEAEESKVDPLSGLSDEYIEFKTTSLPLKDSPVNFSTPKSNSARKQSKKKEGVTQPEMKLPATNGLGVTSDIPITDPEAKAPCSEKTAEVKTEMQPQSVTGRDAEPSSLSMNLQVMQPESLDPTKINSNAGVTSTPPAFSMNSFVMNTPVKGPMDIGFAGNKPVKRRRKRKENGASEISKAESAAVIPDLNGTETENSSIESPGKLSESPQNTSNQKKRRKRNPEDQQQKTKLSMFIEKFGNNLGDSDKTALLLSFNPEACLPSKEALIITFSQFGPLNELETQVLKDSHTARVVFPRKADAAKAYHSLEKSKPFGGSIVKFWLQQLEATSRAAPAMPPATNPSNEAPTLDFIRQNLEMMTAMLEKSGDNLSPGTKAKLEQEIKGLLMKVCTMSGGSSSQ